MMSLHMNWHRSNTWTLDLETLYLLRNFVNSILIYTRLSLTKSLPIRYQIGDPIRYRIGADSIRLHTENKYFACLQLRDVFTVPDSFGLVLYKVPEPKHMILEVHSVLLNMHKHFLFWRLELDSLQDSGYGNVYKEMIDQTHVLN